MKWAIRQWKRRTLPDSVGACPRPGIRMSIREWASLNGIGESTALRLYHKGLTPSSVVRWHRRLKAESYNYSNLRRTVETMQRRLQREKKKYKALRRLFALDLTRNGKLKQWRNLEY